MNETHDGDTKGTEFPMTTAVQHRYRRFEMPFQVPPADTVEAASHEDRCLTPMTRFGFVRDATMESGHFVRQPVKIYLVPRRRRVR